MRLTGAIIVCLFSLFALEIYAQDKINISISQVAKFDSEIHRKRNFGFSVTGKYIWIYDDHSNLSVWLAADSSLVFRKNNVRPNISFSNDDKSVVVLTKERNEILDTASGRTKSILERKLKSYESKYWTGDNKLIVAWIDSSTIGFFDSDTGRLNATLITSEKKSVWHDFSISPDSKWIITINDLGETCLWDASNKKLIQKFDSYYPPMFSPDSRYVGLFTEKSLNISDVQIFDLQTMTFVKVLPKYAGSLVEWSPNSQAFITDRTRDEVSKNEAVIWKLDGTQLATIKTYSKHCFDFVSTCISDNDRFQFKSDGKLLMVSNKKGVRFLEPNNATLIFEASELEGPAIWLPKGDSILALDKKTRKLAVWKINMS